MVNPRPSTARRSVTAGHDGTIQDRHVTVDSASNNYSVGYDFTTVRGYRHPFFYLRDTDPRPWPHDQTDRYSLSISYHRNRNKEFRDDKIPNLNLHNLTMN